MQKMDVVRSAGLPQADQPNQRLAMYMVISKPKRMSLAAGVCHFIMFLQKRNRGLRQLVFKDISNTGVNCACALPHCLSARHGIWPHEYLELPLGFPPRI